MDKLNMESMNIVDERINFIKKIFPEVIVDGKINFDMLKTLLGDNLDISSEKYQFSWNGKSESIKYAQTPSTSTLIPSKIKSKNWDRTQNLYIEGDNLEVLKLLQKTFSRKIDVIYIDPPYNTGNDFVYKDDYVDNVSNYIRTTNQETRSNPNSDGRFHTNWLNMMYPRLLLAKNLLTEKGIIAISIDDHEVENLKKICNEIFGETNFLACVIWERAYAPVNMKKHFSESHDFMLFYAKNIDEAICNGLKRTAEANSRYTNLDNDSRGPWKSGDLTVGMYNAKNYYEIITPSGRSVYPPSGSSWRVTKEKFEEMKLDNRIWFGKDGSAVPSVKRFISEIKDGMTPMTIWKYTDVGHSQDASKYLMNLFEGVSLFDYPKPVELLQRVLELYSNSDSIVLDFFSGSATMAEAVMKSNIDDNGKRKFIMVQLPEKVEKGSEPDKYGYANICEIAQERIRRSGNKIYNELKEKYENSGLFVNDCINPDDLDFGFRVFRLESTNIKAWDSTIKVDENTIFDFNETIKEGRTNLDVAYEIMLKYGVFNMNLKEIVVNNKIVYSVGNDYLIISLNDDITEEDYIAIAKLQPRCVVFKETGFKDDNIKMNASYTLERLGVEDVKCI